MRRLDRQSRNNFITYVKDNLPPNFKGLSPKHKIREGDNPHKVKGIHFHECEGFGHIHTKCTNFLRKQKKRYNDTFSDEEFEEDSEGEKATNVVAFTSRVRTKLLLPMMEANMVALKTRKILLPPSYDQISLYAKLCV